MTKSLWDFAVGCVDVLKEKGLITVTADSHDKALQVTRLGRATYKGKSSSYTGLSTSYYYFDETKYHDDDNDGRQV